MNLFQAHRVQLRVAVYFPGHGLHYLHDPGDELLQPHVVDGVVQTSAVSEPPAAPAKYKNYFLQTLRALCAA